jgi:cell division protein FtsW
VPLIGAGLLLILFEPDLGSVIVVVLVSAGMFFLAGVRVRHLAGAVLPAIALGSFVIFVLGYKKARILDYVSAVIDPLQGSYQVRQAVLTLGSGGLFGSGLGEGRQKLFFLPYPHTDFIYAAMGEEIGLIGLLFVTSLLRLAAGMTWALFVNIAINIGVVTALLPVTGLPLPFISYGGSSLVMSCAAVGVLLNLSRGMAK